MVTENPPLSSATNCSVPAADYQVYLFPAVYSLALVVGLPGNLGALVAFGCRAGPRTAFSVFISSLALADLLSLFTLPFRIHYHLSRNRWVLGDVACRVTGILFHANIYLSMCFMTCICVDRYVATLHPHTYLRLQRTRWSVAVSVALWVAVGVAILVFILMGPLETDGAAPGNHTCFENFDKREWSSRLAGYSLLCLTLGSLLPSLVILVLYPLAARRIGAIKTRTAAKAVRVIYAILAITLLCFLPNHLVYLLHMLGRLGVIRNCAATNAIYHARRVTMAMVILNTVMDPLLYYATTSRCSWSGWRRSCRLWGGARRGLGVYVVNAT